MHWTDRRRRFRAILSGTRCVHPASVFDPLSARIAEDLGFEVGMFAGSVASFTVLGAPDLMVLSLGEFAEQAYRICRAGNLPLLVDADHGYGNALNVKRTVEELETAGVAALSIEDTLLPAAFGAHDETRLVPLAEGVGKMRAALAGRQDPSLVIAGRTSAAAITSVEDAVARAKAYEAAGVDALFLVGVRTREALEALAAAVKLPLILGGAGQALLDLDYLSAHGVRICLQGHQPFMAAVRAVHETLKALRDGTAPAEIAGLAPAALMQRITREEDYRHWMRDFLGAR
ncbi:MAG TPA: isocitrate lyase/phosphoenolpyruvate mutase family protein [Alphaproteobacteria bacterium]|nr:isocitrate lyase/phosphoenolpyruvate mutase family protein [Alphaproteobacteria bacterium]